MCLVHFLKRLRDEVGTFPVGCCRLQVAAALVVCFYFTPPTRRFDFAYQACADMKIVWLTRRIKLESHTWRRGGAPAWM